MKLKSDMMTYKGYKATIFYDKDDKIFIGEVFEIADSLNFHGRSIDELENSFKDSIEIYLDYCKQVEGVRPQNNT